MSGRKQAPSGPPNKRTYVDSATGRKVNDYIPKFISSTPWYYSNEALSIDSRSRKRKTEDELYKEIKDKSNDRLKHQRLNPGGEIIPNNEARRGLGINDEFESLIDNDSSLPKINNKEQNTFRKRVKMWKKKGLCENCGGKHSKMDCLEKPHSLSYLYDDKKASSANDKHDEQQKEILIMKETQEWDAKRDRWRGVDMDAEYDDIVQNLKKKEQNAVEKYLLAKETTKEESEIDKDVDDETQKLIKAVTADNPLAIRSTDTDVTTRSLDAKPRYLEVIKTGEELRYNPKSRVYKDLKEGYLNERNQFIPFLTGEAAEFEKLKKFNRTIQQKQKKKWVENNDGTKTVTATEFATEISPTTAMLKMKEKEEQDKIIKEAKKKELLEKYGAL